MSDDLPSPERSWPDKFRDAFRGVKEGIRGQSSFFVHFFMAAVVLAAGVVLGINQVEWCLLVLCITVVLTTEMLNSALESMAKAITGECDPHLGNSLDIASAAVLIASIGAATVGIVIFGRRVAELLGWL